MYSVLLIDDEPAATQALKRSLEAFKQVQIVGCYNDPQQGIQAICQLSPDIVFMDIEMPIMDGFMVAKATEHIDYHLVYVTAYAEHALTAFETKVIDYLLKPVRQSRLERCIEKIERLSLEMTPSIEAEVLVDDGKRRHRLFASDISYIESIGRYQQLNLTVSGEKKFQLKTIVTEETMADFESQLDSAKFMRVHRSYIINLTLISQLHREARNTSVTLVDAERTIPVARAKLTSLNKHLKFKRDN